MTMTAVPGQPGLNPDESLVTGLLECWGPVTRAELTVLAGLPRTRTLNRLAGVALARQHRAGVRPVLAGDGAGVA